MIHLKLNLGTRIEKLCKRPRLLFSQNDQNDLRNEKKNQSCSKEKELKDFLKAQMEEIQRHKWIESEKARQDLGDKCILEWIQKYAKIFREEWEKKHST